MLVGLHVSAAGGVENAPERAAEKCCECFQFFSRSPQGGKPKEITLKIAQDFKDGCKQFEQKASYIHAPYYINFASENSRIYYGSIEVIRSELERGSLLGVKALMIHTGSAKDLGKDNGLEKAIVGLSKVLEGYKGSTQLLIEIAAGAGAVIGDTFEEVAKIIDDKRLKKYTIGVCFDTAHAFASGYDLRDKKAVTQTFKKFEDTIGRERLVLIHANDSKVELGARRDRHDHLGDGHIGADGFEAIASYAKKYAIDMIIETPHDGKEIDDVKLLKQFRGGK
jgi:deoxyribonuclease-4